MNKHYLQSPSWMKRYYDMGYEYNNHPYELEALEEEKLSRDGAGINSNRATNMFKKLKKLWKYLHLVRRAENESSN